MTTKVSPQPRPITAEEAQSCIARFADARPQSQLQQRDKGIPDAAYEMVSAKSLFTLMASSQNAGPMSARPLIQTSENLSVIIAECPPGDKPMLHAHFHTVEHFFCLKGKFRIRMGDEAEHEFIISPFDLVRVPKGVCRDFTNITDEMAYLLVLITGQREDDYNDIAFPAAETREFKERFGEKVASQMETIGFSFLEK